MATPGRESGHGRNGIDALGINGSSDERGHGMVAPPVRRVTITEPESRPKAPTRRRTFTELFKYGRRLTIYLAIDSQTAVEAKMRIERGPESTCRISQAFLHEKKVDSHPQQPHIELKWSPKRDHFTIAPATLFSICKELQGSDCVLTREEFDKKSQKRSNRKTWRTFLFLANNDDLSEDFKEARKDLARNDILDEVNDIDTKRRMKRDKRSRRNPNSNSSTPVGFQLPYAVPESEVIGTVLSNQVPQTPIHTHHGSVASSTTIQSSSPTSRMSITTTAVSTPKTPGADEMQPLGANKEDKVSLGQKITRIFKPKGKADTNASPQQPSVQSSVIMQLPKHPQHGSTHHAATQQQTS